MSRASAIRTTGYLISTVSVGLLGTVSWQPTSGKPMLRWALCGGMATSLLGMMLRWLSHREQKHEERAGGKPRP